MAFDITPYIDKKPAEVRQLIREGRIDFPTAGMCRGYAQANLVILPPEYAARLRGVCQEEPLSLPHSGDHPGGAAPDPRYGRGGQHLLGHPPGTACMSTVYSPRS
mgnify:CR=1 FL=1